MRGRNGLFILGLALLAAACNAAPPAPVAGTVTVPASSLPGGAAAAATAPSTAVPVATTPTPAATDAPLPSPSTDSDLEGPDQAEVEKAMAGDEALSYLPSDLIHDGGPILYRTLALGDLVNKPDKPDKADKAALGGPLAALASALPGSPGALGAALDCAGALLPPAAWKRNSQGKGGAQLKLRRLPPLDGAPRVGVVFNQQTKGRLTFQETLGAMAGTKPFVELFQRGLTLAKADGSWKVVGATPITLESQAGRSGLDITRVKLFPLEGPSPVATISDAPMIAVDDMPRMLMGQDVGIEVEVQNRKKGELFVFAHVVGRALRSREILVDDGTGADRVADDGTYAGAFKAPSAVDRYHLAIDVLDARAFKACGSYRANGLGIMFQTVSPR